MNDFAETESGPNPQKPAIQPLAAAAGGAAAPGSTMAGNLGTVLGIPVTVQVLLGSAVMPVARLLKLGRGAVITLDRRVGEPVDVVVNGRIVARGEIVSADDDTHFGVSLIEIIGPPGLDGTD